MEADVLVFRIMGTESSRRKAGLFLPQGLSGLQIRYSLPRR
ncbi:hypothetical protein HMPREF3038_01046 [Akkermansia sp. KLE1797]|nr:hypothetical protein HMPREF3038_01046 [Akkermansia sp. KLE1797]KXU53409.1 hypothetical protein HMPREF3039_02410 [Akkermansia sp. KLE1798]